MTRNRLSARPSHAGIVDYLLEGYQAERHRMLYDFVHRHCLVLAALGEDVYGLQLAFLDRHNSFGVGLQSSSQSAKIWVFGGHQELGPDEVH